MGENAHFVERDETPKRGGSEFFPHNDVRRAVALEDAVRGKIGWRAIGLNFVECFSEGEGFGLSKDIRHEEIVVATEGIQRLRESDEVARNETSALVDELVEGMLSVRAWLAPVDDTGVGIDLAAVELDVLAFAFHRELLQVGGEALEVLLIREDSHALGTKKIAIPQPKETVDNGDILIEWSRAKVLIHLMKASQHVADVIRPEGNHI